MMIVCVFFVIEINRWTIFQWLLIWTITIDALYQIKNIAPISNWESFLWNNNCFMRTFIQLLRNISVKLFFVFNNSGCVVFANRAAAWCMHAYTLFNAKERCIKSETWSTYVIMYYIVGCHFMRAAHTIAAAAPHHTKWLTFLFSLSLSP